MARTAGGKNMPCNNQKVYYKQDFHNGDLVLVLPNGKVTKGNLDFESDTFGYISHFATCPSAIMHRKAKENEKQMSIADLRGGE